MPPPVDRPGNAKVIVALETTEVKGPLTYGVQYTFWTFGGTVPGPFVRVRVGDVVQIRLKNAASSMSVVAFAARWSEQDRRAQQIHRVHQINTALGRSPPIEGRSLGLLEQRGAVYRQ